MELMGKRFTQIRKELGLTQREMAERFDVAHTSIRNYELGHTPKGHVLNELSQLGYDLNWLISGKGRMQADTTDLMFTSSKELNSILIWNVAYFMCKRDNNGQDPEAYADAFIQSLEIMSEQYQASLTAEEADEPNSNIIDLALRRLIKK